MPRAFFPLCKVLVTECHGRLSGERTEDRPIFLKLSAEFPKAPKSDCLIYPFGQILLHYPCFRWENEARFVKGSCGFCWLGVSVTFKSGLSPNWKASVSLIHEAWMRLNEVGQEGCTLWSPSITQVGPISNNPICICAHLPASACVTHCRCGLQKEGSRGHLGATVPNP